MSDMCVDACEGIDDSVYGYQPVEENPTVLWNGREVTLVQETDERYNKILQIIHAERTQEPPLKLETENNLASLREHESQFNPCFKATETVVNTILNDPQFDASKASLISRGWLEIARTGHERIDEAFNAVEKVEENQTVANFFETLEIGGAVGKSLVFPLEQPLKAISKSVSSLLPALEPQPSRYFETEGIKRKDIMITFANGMANRFEDAKRNLDHLKRLSGSDLCLEGVYNHTNGAIADLLEIALLNYPGYSPNTQDLLGQKWVEFHERNQDNPDAKILHFCHSQGAIHTRNTLNSLPQEIRDRIIVVAIAPAVVISSELCYQSFNYASKKDIVHRGEDVIATLGLYGAIFHDEDTAGPDMLRQQILETYCKNKAQLILLEPHEGATGIDHNLTSPTFIHHITQRLESYLMGSVACD